MRVIKKLPQREGVQWGRSLVRLYGEKSREARVLVDILKTVYLRSNAESTVVLLNTNNRSLATQCDRFSWQGMGEIQRKV